MSVSHHLLTSAFSDAGLDPASNDPFNFLPPKTLGHIWRSAQSLQPDIVSIGRKKLDFSSHGDGFWYSFFNWLYKVLPFTHHTNSAQSYVGGRERTHSGDWSLLNWFLPREKAYKMDPCFNFKPHTLSSDGFPSSGDPDSEPGEWFLNGTSSKINPKELGVNPKIGEPLFPCAVEHQMSQNKTVNVVRHNPGCRFMAKPLADLGAKKLCEIPDFERSARMSEEDYLKSQEAHKGGLGQCQGYINLFSCKLQENGHAGELGTVGVAVQQPGCSYPRHQHTGFEVYADMQGLSGATWAPKALKRRVGIGRADMGEPEEWGTTPWRSPSSSSSSSSSSDVVSGGRGSSGDLEALGGDVEATDFEQCKVDLHIHAPQEQHSMDSREKGGYTAMYMWFGTPNNSYKWTAGPSGAVKSVQHNGGEEVT